MKRKKLPRRRIFWGLGLVFLASTPWWVDFGAVSAKISALFGAEPPARNEAPPPSVVEKKPSKETLRAKVNELLKKEGLYAALWREQVASREEISQQSLNSSLVFSDKY